jgi:hypothetical protein
MTQEFVITCLSNPVCTLFVGVQSQMILVSHFRCITAGSDYFNLPILLKFFSFCMYVLTYVYVIKSGTEIKLMLD